MERFLEHLAQWSVRVTKCFQYGSSGGLDDYEFKSDGDLSCQRSACLAKEVRRCAEQFWLVDLRKKTIKPLLNAPTVHKEGGRSLAAWTKNNTVLLVNTLLPLDSAQGEELQRRRRNVYVAEVNPATGEIHQIEERGKNLTR